jgi:long-chain acyl-CoA synthetase
MAFMIAQAAARRGDAVALRDEFGQRTWTALDRRVNRLMRALAEAGVGRGDRIALYAGNGIATFELMAAAHHAGVQYVPVNWHFTADELAHVLADSGAVGLFTDWRFASTAAQALSLVPGAAPRLRVCARAGSGKAASGGTADGEGAGGDEGVPAGFVDFEAFVSAQHDDSEPAAQAVGGPMFYTSGTTGRPKGVLRAADGPPPPIESLNAFADFLMQMLQLPRDGTTLLAGPYYHSAQWSFAFGPMLAGSGVVMTQRFDAARTLQLIDSHRLTNVHLVPTQFVRLLRLDAETRAAFSGVSLQRVWHGAAPCPPQAKREMIDWWGPCIHEYYGSTEAGVVTGISSADWLARPGSVGPVIGQADVIVLRDDGSAADVGERGTIYMRNRRGIALRYHNDPEKTRAAHREAGLFTTGDVGWIDVEGFLFLTDRRIDMIISGGVNIYPAEIEAVLASHPAVRDVAVIGVPNAEFGEEVKAVVELEAGRVGDDALRGELERHCRATLAGYKVPRSIEFRERLPRTETGKLQKRLLREPYWQGVGRRI